MLVRFWGTRGSIAKPGSSTLRYGGNTSCVEVRSSNGTLLVLDCGTGAQGLGQALMKSAPPAVNGNMLIGHTHWDHIQGFPFFAPVFAAGNEWHIYGPRGIGASLRESLSGQMQYAYFPVTLEDLGARLVYHDLIEGALDVGDIRVTAQYLNHPALTLGYRLEADGATIVYSTDHEPYSTQRAEGNPVPVAGEEARHARFLSGADLVIHDAQYTADEYPAKRGLGHSTVEYAVDTAASAGVRRLALFHHDPMRSDEAIDQLVDLARERAARTGAVIEIFAAAEGQVLELRRDDAPAPPPETRDQTARWNQAVSRSTGTVLAAVGNPRISRLLEDAAAEDGLRIVSVKDCNAIADMVRSEHASLILLEEGLKNCDALQISRALREDHAAGAAELPIVLLKTTENPASQQREAEAGVTGSLIFPCSKEYVRTKLRAWMLREASRWKNAPLPDDEEARLRALRGTGLLDTEVEERFDRFTRIAAALFEVPIALISLVDKERQWFKSRQGIDATETPRDQAFCAHAILHNDVMQVEDAQADERFADNPLVTREPRVRFYAGAPLTIGGSSAVGTLCVVDHRPRSFDEDQLRLLRDLSKLVERELQIGPGPVTADRGR
jgi:phosphoribosyl 1,2-cyclic phosphodiesterase/DNA-binding response OmpR family regulator